MRFHHNKNKTLSVGALCVMSVLSGGARAAGAGAVAGKIRTDRAGVIYSIARDETLSTVASRFTGDSRNWRQIGKINHIPNDRTVPIGTPIAIPARLLVEKSAFATIAAVHGEVSILGKDGALIVPAVGAAVPEGALVVTSEQGFITLALKDGTVFSVTPGSNLQLTLLRMKEFTGRPRTSLTLEKGRVTSTVTPFTMPDTRYEVHTPLSAAGVRGTQFRVNLDNGKSFNEVLQGTVRVAPPGPGVPAAAARNAKGNVKDLPANHGAVIGAAGQPLASVMLPDPPAVGGSDAAQDKLPARFMLTAPPRADVHSFRASVSRDAKGRDVVANAIVQNAAATDSSAPSPSAATELRIPDLDDGHYYLQVASRDANGLEGKPATAEFTLKAHPLPPFPSAPGAKLRSSVDGKPAEVLFQWADVGPGAAYHLQIASDPGFKQLLLDRAGLKNPEYKHDAVPPGSFYWHVATVETIGGVADQGPYSDLRTLEILPAQQAPQPSQDGDRLHFSWRGEAGQTFVFEIAAGADFAKVLRHIETAEPQAAFERPGAGVYFARVRSIDADGYQGAFSQAQKFEVYGVWKNSYGGAWNSSDGPLRSQF
ncbi:hypothetical protein D9O50_06065 [Oxalobacteraceae bacterium CAVE-383]|nr:hypothetical protein D9O50_06065 [Oxalobacteraceae bacterium CAVE-383]